MMKLPELWFSKRNVKTGIVFDDIISNKNCPDWDNTPFSQLNRKAEQRINYLNKCMPNEWEYRLIGWRV